MIKFTLLASKYITAHFGAYGTLADFIDWLTESRFYFPFRTIHAISETSFLANLLA